MSYKLVGYQRPLNLWRAVLKTEPDIRLGLIEYCAKGSRFKYLY